MSTSDLNAMEIVMAGDELARTAKAALDALSKAEATLETLAAAPSLTREPAEERALHAKAVCSELAAIGSECR
jgi:hypothetical protein